MTRTYRPVNLTGVHWFAGSATRIGGFGAARPGFGVQCVETGQLIVRKGDEAKGPSAWGTKGAATEIAEGVTENGMMPGYTLVTPIPPTPSRWSGSEKKYRQTWDSAPQRLSVYYGGELTGRYTTCGLVSAWVIIRQNDYLSREVAKAGYRITVEPAS